jgi:hypothetical protein
MLSSIYNYYLCTLVTYSCLSIFIFITYLHLFYKYYLVIFITYLHLFYKYYLVIFITLITYLYLFIIIYSNLSIDIHIYSLIVLKTLQFSETRHTIFQFPRTAIMFYHG